MELVKTSNKVSENQTMNEIRQQMKEEKKPNGLLSAIIIKMVFFFSKIRRSFEIE